jgi:hypothetical protein
VIEGKAKLFFFHLPALPTKKPPLTPLAASAGSTFCVTSATVSEDRFDQSQLFGNDRCLREGDGWSRR